MRTVPARWVGVAATAAMAVWLAAISFARPADTSLLDAAESGDRATVLRLLAKGADPNALAADGTTAIMWAASNDDLDLVRALIKAGANVKLKNRFGTSALTEAAIIGSAPVIDALLKAGADPNTKNPEGETPLMAVARSGKIEAARRLLDAGADVNAKEDWGGQSALMWAAAQSQAEMVKFLASRGADVNARGVIRQWERKVITEPWFHLVVVCRARRLRRVCAAPDCGQGRPRSCRHRRRNAAEYGAAQSAFRLRRRYDRSRR